MRYLRILLPLLALLWAPCAGSSLWAGSSAAAEGIEDEHKEEAPAEEAEAGDSGQALSEEAEEPHSYPLIGLSTHVLSYGKNGALCGIPPFVAGRWPAGGECPVADNQNGLERPGYVFVGWNTKANGSGQYYAPGSRFRFANADVQLCAQWEPETDLFCPYMEHWETELRKLDRLSTPRNSIIAVGSSTMRFWKNVAQDLDLPVANRAFGGSTSANQICAMMRLVIPYRPKMIIYYCGDNDLWSPTADPYKPVRNFIYYATELHGILPAARILYIGIKPSIQRWPEYSLAEKANAAIAAWAELHPYVSVVDPGKALLDAAGMPRPELYVPDRLHLSAQGYQILASAVRPIAQKIWAELGQKSPSSAGKPLSAPSPHGKSLRVPSRP